MLWLGALGVAALALAAVDSGQSLRGLVAMLPDRGRGWRFFVTSLLAQLAIAAATQASEGLVIPADHVPAIVLAGFLAAGLGALVCRFFTRRLLALVLALFAFVARELEEAIRACVLPRALRRPAHAFVPHVLSRPPPSDR